MIIRLKCIACGWEREAQDGEVKSLLAFLKESRVKHDEESPECIRLQDTVQDNDERDMFTGLYNYQLTTESQWDPNSSDDKEGKT
ncbi:hypothetical protein [Candidatus Magnetobacterium casense]|uniref:Uncharacterized protein n=1 Tax=Candidatus Magnetobacterium casense TaxID=1455061 RepID=A0ABS6S5K2_9BACT|nr:hypothetical protein [Candidatus Magnetobacterium casensis]MBV6343779.1 hypothetical protein [Candidatus Magnetobacterium casensis]